MRIFQNLSSSDGEKTIREGVAAIVECAQELHLLDRKWSLAELQLDADDFAWLRDWASNLSGKMVQLWLEEQPWRTFRLGTRECTYSTASGIFLLLFTTETARRKATEGFLWTVFQQDCFPGSTARALYTGGQPTRAHRDALEKAARWLQLRDVFGIEGLQNWFDTVYLQFGFTYRGFLRRLPEWLVGQGGTQAIQQLLDGPMRSDTFRTLWNDLRNFRRHNVTVEQMKVRLAHNPWILPEWIDELLTQATARIELGEGADTHNVEASDRIEPFLTEPLLRWEPPKLPEFLSSVANIAQFDLSESTYYVMVNGRVYTQLQRGPDGIYSFYPSEEIMLPATFPILVATLISSTGQVIASNTLTLWDINEEVTLFRAVSGKRIDAWQDMMRSETAYFLLTAPDVTIVPEPAYWYKLDIQGTTLSLIDTGWLASLNAWLAGQLIWQPNIKDLKIGEEPRWARSVDISFYDTSSQISFGDTVQVSIDHPHDVCISFIRLGARAVNFTERDDRSALTEPIVVSPDILFHGTHLAELCFTIGINTASSFTRITRTLSVELVGAAMLSIQGWMALQPQTILTVEQAKTFPVQIFRSNLKKWAILEGDSWVGRPHPTPHPIGSLAGLGSPLKLRLGPYNAIEPDSLLVQEVVNKGIIADLKLNQERGDFSYTIHLIYPIELDDRHQVIIWDERGQLHIGNSDHMLVQVPETPSWILELPDSAARPLVIAIAYDGVRLGAWWQGEWSTILRQQHTQDDKTVATMLRWFQLPILSDQHLDQVRQLVQHAGSHILPVWLSDTSPRQELRWVEGDDQWLSAVRTVFKYWRPGDMAARRLVTQLGGTGENIEELLTRTAWRLLRVDPLLMGRVLRRFVLEAYLPQFGPKATQALFRTLVSVLAESVNEYEVQQQKNALLEAISDTMGYIDSNFIRRGLLDPALRLFNGHTITPLEENNISLALSIEPFRRLSGIRIFESIIQSIATRR